MSDECKKEAATLCCELTKQFLTLAFAGIAFVVGLFTSNPGEVSRTYLLWSIWLFVGSAICGFLLLMRGIQRLNEEKSFDFVIPSIRWMSGLQIISFAVGLSVLIPIVYARPAEAAAVRHHNAIELKLTGQQSLTYPLDPEKNVTIEIDGT